LLSAVLLQSASAQTIPDVFEAINEGGYYADPYEACIQSHQSYSANNGLTPTLFYPTYDETGTIKSMYCKYDNGGSGYWGTNGSAFLRCPSGTAKTGDFRFCGLAEDVGSCKDLATVQRGNPIDVSTGTKIQIETDFSVGSGRLHFVRTYTSRGVVKTALGDNWSSNFHPQVKGYRLWYRGFFTLVLPSGQTIRFFKSNQDNGAWLPPSIPWGGWYAREGHDRGDLQYSLTEIDENTLVLSYPDGHEQEFRFSASGAADPILYEERYPDGYTISFNYDSNRVLQSVTDSFGKTITFTYNQNGFLETVTDPSGAEYLYAYLSHTVGSYVTSTGNLEYVTFPDDTPLDTQDNAYKQYIYDDPNGWRNLTGIIDERGIRIRTWTYQDDRATSSQGANGNLLTTISDISPADEVTVTNPLGKEAIYTFARYRGIRKLATTDGVATPSCSASSASQSYNSYGQLTSLVAPEGQTTVITPDLASGLPSSVTYGSGTPEETTVNYVWDTAIRRPLEIERPELLTEITYDANANPITIALTDTTSHTVPYTTNGTRRVWAYTWFANGLLSSVDGPLSGTGDTISFTYDTAGNLATVTDENGLTATINSVDGNGRPVLLTEPNGLQTSFNYSSRGWLTSVIENPGPQERITDLAYDDAGNLVRIDLPGGGWFEYDYDDSGWLVSATSSVSGEITYEYDAAGNVTQTDFRDGSGTSLAQMSSVHDELGRLIQLLGGAGDLHTYGYDRSDRKTTDIDGLGRSWLTSFDALDRVISETDPETDSVQYGWQSLDQMESFTDGRSLVTSYTRNGFGDVIREVSPDRGTTDYWYDAAGRVTRRLDAAGHDVLFTYDDGGRVLAEAYPNQAGLNISFDYDDTTSGNMGAGRLTGISGAVVSNAYTYDVFGQLISQSDQIASEAYTTEFEYSPDGGLEQITLPSGREVVYSSDSVGRVIGVSSRSGSGATLVPVLSSIAYAPYGPVTGYALGNGSAVTFSLDSSYRLTGLSLSDGTSDVIDKAYSYDANSRVVAITDALNSAASATYTYHDDGRLKRATGPWGDVEWDYDAVGNRITDKLYISGVLADTETYSYGATDNRLMSIRDDTPTVVRSFSYSADGSVSQDIQASTTAYSFGENGRLSSVTAAGAQTVSYDYNAFGMRIRRIDQSGAETHFVFTPSGQLLGEYDGATGGVINEYIWFGRHLVATVDAAGAIFYVQTGHLGQPLMVMDGTSQVLWQGETSPFGTYVYTAGAISDPGLRLPGQWLEEGSGLYQNWYRDYDATIGRYIEVDPLGVYAGQSVYGYTLQDPLNMFDALGLEADYLDPGLSPEERANRAHDSTAAAVGLLVNPFGKSPFAPPMTQMIGDGAVAQMNGEDYAAPSPEEFCFSFMGPLEVASVGKGPLASLLSALRGPASKPPTPRLTPLPVPGEVDRGYLAPGGRGPVLRGRLNE
jgi:RHS repeat-associated protein